MNALDDAKFLNSASKNSALNEKFRRIKEEPDYEYFAMSWFRLQLRLFNRKYALMVSNEGTKISEFLKEIKVLDDNYRWLTASWLTMPLSHTFKPIEMFILRCHENGIIEYWTEMFYQDRSKEIKDDPKKLTMDIMSAGFYIWLGSVAVACLVFIGEHIYCFIVRRRSESERKEERISKAEAVKSMNKKKNGPSYIKT